MPNLISTISFGLCLNYTGPSRLRYIFQVVQTQTTTAYCRILPALDHHVWDIFSGSSDTNHDSLL